MKPLPIAFIFSITIFSCGSPASPTIENEAPPVAKKVADTFREHGNTRIDYYNWLSDKEDSAVIRHLENENAFTAASLAHTEDTQQKIYEELVGRLDPTESSLPTSSS